MPMIECIQPPVRDLKKRPLAAKLGPNLYTFGRDQQGKLVTEVTDPQDIATFLRNVDTFRYAPEGAPSQVDFAAAQKTRAMQEVTDAATRAMEEQDEKARLERENALAQEAAKTKAAQDEAESQRKRADDLEAKLAALAAKVEALSNAAGTPGTGVALGGVAADGRRESPDANPQSGPQQQAQEGEAAEVQKQAARQRIFGDDEPPPRAPAPGSKPASHHAKPSGAKPK